MSWSKAARGIFVYNDAGRGDRLLPVTSTSTVLHSRGDSDALLRMYFVVTADTTSSDPSDAAVDVLTVSLIPDALPSHTGLSPAASFWSYIKYLDSDADGNFTIDENIDGSLPQTWIAQTRKFSSWTIHLSTGQVWSVSGEADYNDPSVVPVPASCGAGYLMLLSRKRRDITGLSHYPQARDTPIELQGIFDIVVYWSENLEFNDPDAASGPVADPAVKGPLLLVDAIDALPDAPFRLFIGVPSAAFHYDESIGQMSLYVYYTVDFPEVPYLTAEDRSYKDAVRGSPYAPWYESGGVYKPRGFIACKRFDWVDLAASFSDPPAESSWEDAMDGELPGRVRVWVPQPFVRMRRRATELLVAFPTTVQRCTDPEVEVISDTSDRTLSPPVGAGVPNPGRFYQRASAALRASRGRVTEPDEEPPDSGESSDPITAAPLTFSLYFRAVPSTDDAIRAARWEDGQGIWRATAMPGGVTLEVEDADATAVLQHRATIFGLDFAVTPNGAPSQSRDLVIPAEVDPRDLLAAKTDPTDPDPVRVPQGLSARWWVFAGQIGFPDPGGSPFSHPIALGSVIGDEEDGQWPWEEAWRFA